MSSPKTKEDRIKASLERMSEKLLVKWAKEDSVKIFGFSLTETTPRNFQEEVIGKRLSNP